MRTKEQHNQYHKEYNKRRYDDRIKLAREILGNKCAFCESPEKLHVDHIAPIEKKYDIAYTTRLSMEKFLDELKKCQLLCDSCHSFKTAVQNFRVVDHGGGISGKKNCSCILCKAKMKEYMKNYMKIRRLKISEEKLAEQL